MVRDGRLATDEVHSLVAAQPRRVVLSYLFDANRSATWRELVQASAVALTESAPEELTGTEAEEIQIALHHMHLPMLEDHDVITWDVVTGDVALTDKADVLEPYVREVDVPDQPALARAL